MSSGALVLVALDAIGTVIWSDLVFEAPGFATRRRR